MKPRLSMGVCVLISLVLVLVGLGYGTYGGFADERKAATDLLSQANGLTDVLEYRGADGLNLCVVAERHLTGDEAVSTLRELSRTLADSASALSQRRDADKRLDAAVSAVAEKLAQTDSFQQSERDQRYLTLLRGDMQSLSQSAVSDTYNAAAEAFNAKLNNTVMGRLAGLLGIQPCDLY